MDNQVVSETLTSLREYQALLNQLSILVLTVSGILIHMNRSRLKSLEFGMSGIGFATGVLALILGLSFQGKLIDLIPDSYLKENPTSFASADLRCLMKLQFWLLILGTGALGFASILTRKEKDEVRI